jgi:hypothetical protein
LDLVVSIMLIKFFFISFFIGMVCLVNGQTVVVNPDGTHTIVLGSVIVHPNGQHSVVHTTGAHSVVVGPDGRHTVIVGLDQPGSPKIVVHPDGRHSQVYSSGINTLVVGPNGTHTVYTQGLTPVDLHVQLAMILLLMPLIHP